MRYDINEVNKVPVNTTGTLSTNGELSRLITAAVVNRKFCDLLLADPRLALAGGYKGEVFQLTAEEYHLVLSIRAKTLADFAMQLAKNLKGTGAGSSPNGNGNGNGAGGNGHYDNTNGTSK